MVRRLLLVEFGMNWRTDFERQLIFRRDAYIFISDEEKSAKDGLPFRNTILVMNRLVLPGSSTIATSQRSIVVSFSLSCEVSPLLTLKIDNRA